MYMSSINLRLGYLRHKAGRVKYTQKPLSVKTISLSALKRPFRVKTFGFHTNSVYSQFSPLPVYAHTHMNIKIFAITYTLHIYVNMLSFIMIWVPFILMTFNCQTGTNYFRCITGYAISIRSCVMHRSNKTHAIMKCFQPLYLLA